MSDLFKQSLNTLARKTLSPPIANRPRLRDYFPKRTDLRGHATERLVAVADEINTRPRKTLAWATPADLFDRHQALGHTPQAG
jgi:hypothetical protein